VKTHLSSQAKINEAIAHLLTLPTDGSYEFEAKKLPHQRTIKQNAGMWLYLSMTAKALNEAGFEMVVTIAKKEVQIPWTKDTLKQVVWDGIMVKLLNKESTTELETDEVTQVYEVMNRFTSDTFGVGMNFPSKESIGDG